MVQFFGMKTRKILASIIAVSLLLPPFSYANEYVEENADTGETSLEQISDGVIVKFKSESTDPEVFAENENLTIVDILSDSNISVVVSADDASVEETIEAIKDSPEVEYVEPNYIRSISVISTDDTYKDDQWALNNTGQSVNNAIGTADADINAPEAWIISEGENADIIVAVIDSGVDYSNPDLANQMWDGSSCVDENNVAISEGCNHGYDFANNDITPLPEAASSTPYHGTHVAGIIAAQKNNATGTIGIAPRSKIMAIRFGLDVASEVRAIDFARLNGAKIINASFSGPGFSQSEYDAIKRFTDGGGIFVAAASNNSADNDILEGVHQYPSDYDIGGIVSVAATDQDDVLASFSNYGQTSIDIAAPGVNIISTWGGNGYAFASGTSMATPYTAGTLALLFGYNTRLSTTTAKGILLQTGRELPSLSGKTVTGKRIDAEAALAIFAPQVSNLSLGTSTNGVATFTFDVLDGYAGLSATLANFAYSTTSGDTWVELSTSTASSTLSGDWHQTLDTQTSTSSRYSMSWNVQYSSLEEKNVLLASTTSIQIRFNAFDGATTSAKVVSSSFSFVEVVEATSTPPVTDNNSGGSTGGSSSGGGGGPVTEVIVAKKGDINSDKIIDVLDFNVLMINWNKNGKTVADLNGDEIVDILDFNVLMINWNKVVN